MAANRAQPSSRATWSDQADCLLQSARSKSPKCIVQELPRFPFPSIVMCSDTLFFSQDNACCGLLNALCLLHRQTPVLPPEHCNVQCHMCFYCLSLTMHAAGETPGWFLALRRHGRDRNSPCVCVTDPNPLILTQQHQLACSVTPLQRL